MSDTPSSKKSLEIQSTKKKGKELASYISDIADTVRISLDQSIAILTPWFFNNMPDNYYQATPRAEKVRHLSAIITGHIFDSKQTIELWDRDHSRVTFIGPGGDQKALMDMARKLGKFHLKMGTLYFSRDRLLFLGYFFCNEFQPVSSSNPHSLEKAAKAKESLLEEFPDEKSEISVFINNLDANFVMYATVRRLTITYSMLRHMLTHEGAHTFLENVNSKTEKRLVLGLKGVDLANFLDNAVHLIDRYQFEVRRYFVAEFTEGYTEPIVVLHFIIKKNEAVAADAEKFNTKKLVKALKTLAWVDGDDYTEFAKDPFLFSINAANLFRAISSWIHILLSKENPYYYSSYKIFQTMRSNEEICKNILELFRIKFDPLRAAKRKTKAYDKMQELIRKQIALVIDTVEKAILYEAVHFINHILKTNYFLSTKTGLAFRLDPQILDPKYYPESPFGIYFIIGRDYRLFHVRWKDIARGGLRVVMPRSKTEHGYALSGLFDEVYGLSKAQQLKNKDIPEGGSKGVIVIYPGGSKTRAVRGAINALLDLLVPEDEYNQEKANKLVSYYTEEEIIYLGPDENMTNDLLVWVAEQAKKRKYPYASAFISSKPGDGINHKEYGVTSEGVNVFLDRLLYFMEINPKKQQFSVKMTGGPDGDVAGNELKILYRTYKENARVVSIADGFGAAYDSEGLDWKELLRLVKEGLSIEHFDASKLSKSAKSYVVKADTNENIKKRNQQPMLVKADVFIPAGGRPYTVNKDNVQKFMDKNGVPSCRAIVEGANIFFTDEARSILQKHGVFIVKDSSANKTGVICSSYEIIASLLLTSEEFLKIKKAYVDQVVGILQEKAAQEAELLFSEYKKLRGRVNLVDISKEISKTINNITDVLLEEFLEHPEEVLKKKLCQDLVLKHIPQVLLDNYGGRVLKKLPKAHQIAILASYIASFVVYKEGLAWVNGVSEDRLYGFVMTYMENSQSAERLITSISDSKIKDKDMILTVLKRGAARDLTMLAFEDKNS